MIVGIDLGTTNSLIGIFDGSAPRLIPNALGELLTPSVVNIDMDNVVLVGRAARDRLVTQPTRTAATFKRWTGTPRETRLGNRSFRPEELSALVLRSLLADAENHLGEKVTEAVISVPAYFGDAQRKATRTAGELAGVHVERLINEPTAAALSYGLHERRDGSSFIVLDLGGGTFDVSILEMFDGVMQVHASAGDNRLGGEDFLQTLLNACCSDLKMDAGRLAPEQMAQLQSKLERMKRVLSAKDSGSIEFETAEGQRTWSIDADRFEKLCEPLSQRLRQPIERAVRDSRLRLDQIDEVVLVGGASRMPLMPRLVARMLGRLPMRHVDPDHAIALGACIAAGMKAGNASLEEIVLTDVCPYTLGVEISRENPDGGYTSGVFSPVIERNCAVPVSRSEMYHPIQMGQREIVLNVYQGESPLVANNMCLGQLKVQVRPSGNPKEDMVDVRFTYDVNGLLQVEATPRSTGVRHELILQQGSTALTTTEIRTRLHELASLKVHPREDQQNISLIARADRLYAEHLGAVREHVQALLLRFMAILDRQDPREIVVSRKEFDRALSELESGLDR